MDRQRIEGGLKKATGSIKEQAGEAIGDRHLEGEGKAEKTEGHIRSGVGKAMDAIREVVEKEKPELKKASHDKERPAGFALGGASLCRDGAALVPDYLSVKALRKRFRVARGFEFQVEDRGPGNQR